MPSIDIVRESGLERTVRVQQLEAMFDVPPHEKTKVEWHGAFDLPDEWNVGLIVGPSGSGKSTIAGELFGMPAEFDWRSKSVIDDLGTELSIEDVAKSCQSVGFNTIPNWMRPYQVLSTGEKCRVEIARRMLETDGIIVCDEFTSVVDRQIGKIVAHAVQKWARRAKRQFVAATCHYDVTEWLQPDWVLEMPTLSFTRRRLRRRPELAAEIQRVDYSAWKLFAPFHYLTTNLHRAARCFVLFIEGQPAAFAGMLHRPHPKVQDIMGCSRLVTLPDYQGIGLAPCLLDRVAAAYKGMGKRVRSYPAHPSLIRIFDRSSCWALKKKPGQYSPANSRTSSLGKNNRFGSRPCAVFEYVGSASSEMESRRLIMAP